MRRAIFAAALVCVGCTTPGLEAVPIIVAHGKHDPRATLAPPPQTVGEMVVAAAPIEVLTSEDYVAPPELVRALTMMRMPETGRFAFTIVSFDPRTGERRGLRFDPRLQDGSRWSVSEAPVRENLNRVARRVQREMEPIRNPDIAMLGATPSPNAMRFTGLAREDDVGAVYAFQMIGRIEAVNDYADRIVGELAVSRVSGAPLSVRLTNTETIRSGVARIDRLELTYNFTEVSGCCMLATEQSQSARGSALLMPGVTFESSTLADVEYFPDLPRDSVAAE